MSYSDTVNSSKNLFNPVKSIPNEFIFSNECDFNSLIFSFFKTFSTHITSPQSKIKFDPKIYDAKNDFNIATIYEKGKKLYLKSGNYENEFDDFYTKVNRHKEQKRKIRQSLKNGSLIYEVPLFKTINLNDLNEKVYEDTIFSREYKYDYISNIFYPLNDQRLDKDENIIFKLNQKSKYNNKGSLVVLDNTKIEDNEEDKIEEDNEEMTDNNNNNNDIVINNFKNDAKDIPKEDLAYFKNNEIMIEITKYDNFIQENISLFLLNLSNNQNNSDIKNNNNINSIENILKTTDNPYILDTINYFNNIFTPEIYNKFSFYKNIKINNKSQTLKEINSVLDLEDKEEEDNKLKNSKLILDEENDINLINNIKKYFDEETVKEINKDVEITQNFTHFYIEGNSFTKDNFKKIISFLNKENFYMFAWSYNKEQTKKFGIINNIIKVANLSNKVWFYINSKKSNDDIQ
jgi:hypothetical protein